MTPEMALAVTNSSIRATPNSDDISIMLNIDFKIPSHSNASNAFDALGRAVVTKKSLKEQICDAKAIIDLPVDPKQYPKIQGSDKWFYHLCDGKHTQGWS